MSLQARGSRLEGDGIILPPATSGLSAMEAAKRWATEAGALALTRFRRPQDVTMKGRGNLLTETDLEIERFIHDAIEREFPDHRVLSEETASETAIDGWVWVVDPIDGTRNFVSGIPFYCVNIALCRNGTPVLGVTHDPNHGETFWAEQGRGAWINDARIAASDKPSVQASVLGIDIGYDDRRAKAMLQLAYEIFPGVQSLRIPGSAALGLAYAACGRYDLFVHHYLFPWDLAAGIVLVNEAGGAVTQRDGSPIAIESQTVMAGGREAHTDLLQWLASHEGHLDQID